MRADGVLRRTCARRCRVPAARRASAAAAACAQRLRRFGGGLMARDARRAGAARRARAGRRAVPGPQCPVRAAMRLGMQVCAAAGRAPCAALSPRLTFGRARGQRVAGSEWLPGPGAVARCGAAAHTLSTHCVCECRRPRPQVALYMFGSGYAPQEDPEGAALEHLIATLFKPADEVGLAGEGWAGPLWGLCTVHARQVQAQGCACAHPARGGMEMSARGVSAVLPAGVPLATALPAERQRLVARRSCLRGGGAHSGTPGAEALPAAGPRQRASAARNAPRPQPTTP